MLAIGLPGALGVWWAVGDLRRGELLLYVLIGLAAVLIVVGMPFVIAAERKRRRSQPNHPMRLRSRRETPAGDVLAHNVT